MVDENKSISPYASYRSLAYAAFCGFLLAVILLVTLGMPSPIQIQVVSMVTAVGALVYAILQGRETINHNKLTLTPNLAVNVEFQPGYPQIEIILENQGGGPAIITDIEVGLDGIRMPITSLQNGDFLQKKFKLPLVYIEATTLGKGSWLIAGEKHNMLRLQTTRKDRLDPHFNPEKYKERVYRLNFLIKYESIYRDQMEDIIFPQCMTSFDASAKVDAL